MIIIGAGMAGLSTGCYAQMNGIQSRIFEMNHRAGGLCQSWQRQDYTVNGCIHWLVGSNEQSPFYTVWRELGIPREMKFFDHDRFGHYEHPTGTVILYADVDQLAQHLIDVAPEDERLIRQLARGIRALSDYDLGPLDEKHGLAALLHNVRLFVTRFPMMRETMKWWRMTIREFADQLESPALQAVFRDFWHADMSMITFVMTMAFLNKQIAGYPIGGSSAFMDRIVRRYESLGGAIRYDSPVEEILVEDGEARGVRLSDGSLFYADYIVSAADGHTTLSDMLKGEYTDEHTRRRYEELKPFPPLLLAAFGVDHPFEEIPSSVAGIDFPLHRPLEIGNRKIHRLNFQVYNFDPTLAPAGKTTLTTMIEADYDHWEALYQDREKYEAAKQKVLQQLIRALEERSPGIAGKIEMSDLSTPATFYHYTGNFRGSYEGWLPTPGALRTQMSKTLPGLDNFYMVGQWVEPGGGLPPSAMSGRKVIQAICRKEGVPFRTTTTGMKKEKVVS